ncbi:MAG TPA: cupredoxin domain-containing protein [Acetobacteraceae bacterium]
MHRLHLAGAASIAALLALHAPACAQDVPTFRLTLKDHQFTPAELQVPAGVRFVLMVRNEDSTPAEFESNELGAEKIISAGREATIRVGPLKVGRYLFADEFNSQATGALIAVQKSASE